MSRSINQVFAENLAHYMRVRGFTSQPALAKAAKLAQRTIGNYLRPDLRHVSKSGKAPSAKLTEVALLAKVLEVDIVELLRDTTPAEREARAHVESAFRALVAAAPPPPTPPAVEDVELVIQGIQGKRKPEPVSVKKVLRKKSTPRRQQREGGGK